MRAALASASTTSDSPGTWPDRCSIAGSEGDGDDQRPRTALHADVRQSVAHQSNLRSLERRTPLPGDEPTTYRSGLGSKLRPIVLPLAAAVGFAEAGSPSQWPSPLGVRIAACAVIGVVWVVCLYGFVNTMGWGVRVWPERDRFRVRGTLRRYWVDWADVDRFEIRGSGPKARACVVLRNGKAIKIPGLGSPAWRTGDRSMMREPVAALNAELARRKAALTKSSGGLRSVA